MKMYDIHKATLEELINFWKSRDKKASGMSGELCRCRGRLLEFRNKEVKDFNERVKQNPNIYQNKFHNTYTGYNKTYEAELKQLIDRWNHFDLPFDSRSDDERFLGSHFHAGAQI